MAASEILAGRVRLAFAQFPHFSRHLRDALGGVVVGGRKRRDDMDVVENDILTAIGLGQMVKALRSDG